MSGKERRVSPRRDCAVPFRFRIITNAMIASPAERSAGQGGVAAVPSRIFWKARP
jgi:hypothetical protein